MQGRKWELLAGTCLHNCLGATFSLFKGTGHAIPQYVSQWDLRSNQENIASSQGQLSKPHLNWAEKRHTF